MAKRYNEKTGATKLVQVRILEEDWMELEQLAISESTPGGRVYVSTLVKRLIDEHLLKARKRK